MKKLVLLIAGVLVVSGTALADCGSCGADAEKAQKKATCEMKATQDKAACAMKSAEDKAACTKDNAACEMKKKCGADCKKPCCAAKDMTGKACEQTQEKSKKWWKFGFGK